MALRDLVKFNGETNVPVRREETGWSPTTYGNTSQWMDQWFDNFFNRAFSLTPFRNMQSLCGPEWASQWGNWNSFVPAVNVTENENEVRITAELPGMDPKDVELLVNNGSLTIKGEKKQENEDRGKGYYRMERSYVAFHRSIHLPEGIDQEHVDASYRNGVLTVTVPKLPEQQRGAKRIPVRSESYNGNGNNGHSNSNGNNR